ncbi:MAG: hypothetical protein OXD46_10300 [Chloroflexi bacterium]|nr:hypothetical protein [Chloroflexota bacterium]
MVEAPALNKAATHPAFAVPRTPSFVFAAAAMRRTASGIRTASRSAGCTLLYSVKANAVPGVLTALAPFIDGFGVSSLVEAKKARNALGDSGLLHLCTVAVPPKDASELANICDYATFNSLAQLQRWGPLFAERTSIGLRVNPGHSFLDDHRYDPCRPHTKLGISLDDLAASADRIAPLVDGLHVHSNCDSTNLGELLETVRLLDSRIGHLLSQVKWVNLGGGYLFDEGTDLDPLKKAAGLIRDRHGAEVIIEPGAAFVRDSGYIVASVLDLFDSDGKAVAVLDTTVNHMPEVFEYQYCPDVLGHSDSGAYEYVLAGMSCLAGDVFGDYRFDDPLQVGSRVVFTNAGAYTLVKANTFNGIALPSVYELSDEGRFVEMEGTP